MKRIIIIALAISASLSLSAREVPIKQNELPAPARELLSKHFSDISISFATLDSELFSKEYNVVLENGTKIEFDSKGEWKSIDCKNSYVPSALVPDVVYEQLKELFQKDEIQVKEIDKDGRHIEFELPNGVGVKYTLSGKLVEIDD